MIQYFDKYWTEVTSYKHKQLSKDAQNSKMHHFQRQAVVAADLAKQYMKPWQKVELYMKQVISYMEGVPLKHFPPQHYAEDHWWCKFKSNPVFFIFLKIAKGSGLWLKNLGATIRLLKSPDLADLINSESHQNTNEIQHWFWDNPLK